MRVREYLVFLYRIFLVYFFYAIARGLFIYFNHDVMGDYSATDLFYYGLAFDNCAIMYINLLFILLSLLPLWVNTHPKFQKLVFWVYFIPKLTPLILSIWCIIHSVNRVLLQLLLRLLSTNRTKQPYFLLSW